MEIEVKVDQGGVQKCLICGNDFDWSFDVTKGTVPLVDK